MKTPDQRKEAALAYFRSAPGTGDWLLGLIELGIESCEGDGYDAATENPRDAAHARMLTVEEYSDQLRLALIDYLSTPAGAKSCATVFKPLYEGLVDDVDEEEL